MVLFPVDTNVILLCLLLAVQSTDVLKLHRHIQAYFVEAMDKLYLREISSMEWSDRTLQVAPKSEGHHDSGLTRISGAPGSERAMMTAVDVQSKIQALCVISSDGRYSRDEAD